MKSKILSIIAVLAILSLTACGTEPIDIPVPDTNNNAPGTDSIIPQKSEDEIAKASLVDGSEWKPSTGYYYDSESGLIDEYSVTTIYGKYGEVGGITFNNDGTFRKFIGVYEAEEESDKVGTYTVDAKEHTITFNYSKGSVVTIEYDYTNEGKVMYFIYPEGEVSVRFDPSFLPSENDTDREKTETYKKYESVINEYKNAIQEFNFDDLDIEEKIEKKYSLVNMNLLEHVARYQKDGVKLTYSFYDIDDNTSSPELLVGASGSIGAIYSYDAKANKPVKIFFQDTLERGDLTFYDNGVILSSGSGGAALHYFEFGKIAKDGASYELLEAIEEEYMSENEPPVYRNAKTQETLGYKSIDEAFNKYVPDSTEIEINNYRYI